MPKPRDPFAIKEMGGDIHDRGVAGFAERRFEGTSLGEPGLGRTLRRVITQNIPYTLAAVACLFCLALLGRLYYLQVVGGVHYRELAEGNRIRLEVTPAPRGLVVDRNGLVLASNTPSFQLVAIPADLPKVDTDRQELLTNLLAQVPTNLLDQDNLSSLGLDSYLPRVIAYDLPHDLALQIMIKAARQPGLRVVAASARQYYDGAAFGNLLGYVGKLSPEQYAAEPDAYQFTDQVGKSGLEAAYETELRGLPGKREVEVDAQGQARTVYASSDPTPGAKLQLTLDADLQALSYQSLKAAIPAGSKTGGSVVVMNPKTGELLSLVSYPSFEPNLFTVARDQTKISALLTDPRQPFFNRAIAGLYPSGSTIKPLLAAAGLQEGVITPQTTVLSTGGIKLGDQFFADWKAGGHGLVNLYAAIAESVNTFFYLLGGGGEGRTGLGISRIDEYLSYFGIDKALGLDLPGARDGFLPTPAWKQAVSHDRWYTGDTYNVSIGQGGLLVTPLHLAVAYAALLTGGKLPQPYLLQSVTTAPGQTSQTEPHTLAQVPVAAADFQVLMAAMRQTVTAGSARSLGSLPIEVAGKTGTAQTGPHTATHAWFAGYAPATNPEIVVMVMVENGGEGSTTAVPIARAIFTWYAAHRHEFTSQ